MNWKKAGKWFLFPHPIVASLLVVAAAVLLVYSFLFLKTTDLISIASYALSFYALVVACLRMPDLIRFALRFKRKNKYVVRYASDVRLRMNLSLLGAFAFNAVYAAFQLALGLRHHSVWFYAMAVYYLLLAMMRLLLIRYTGTHAPGEVQELEWKKYRICGACLLAMNLALGIMIIYFVFRIRIFRHHEITTIAMAAYTFASLTMAILNVIRYAHYQSPAYSAAKDISLVSAIVSMLTLENAMLTTFGEQNGERFQQIMLGITGVGVLMIVHGISLYMILKARRKLKTLSSSSNNLYGYDK